MKLEVLLLLFAAVAGLFIMPEITARFAGSHTMELGADRAESLQCVKCHEYILDELNATVESRVVYAKHRAAAGNESYTLGWLNLNITNSSDFGVCQMCHLSQIAQNTTHTKAVVRACTDLDCHGSNAATNNTAYATGNMGPLLGEKNVHSRVFDSLSSIDSTYYNETGDAYSKGLFFCITCHTEVDAQLTYPGDTIESFLHNNSDVTRRRYL
jgi:hypothetical protein